MSGVKISRLPEASLASATDQLEANQNGTTRRITVGQVADLVSIDAGTSALTDVSPRDYGAVGNGIVDDTLALQAAIDACAAVGGGNVNCTGGRWLIDSANLFIRKGVFVVGSWLNYGRPGDNAGDYSTVKTALIVNSSFTVQLIDRDCGIKGMVILRKGLAVPTSNRTAIDIKNAFAGTAITIGDGTVQKANDTWLSNLFIAGFATAITSDLSDRPRIEYVTGDCTNGIYITRCFDMVHLSHAHFWPFVTSAWNPDRSTYAVTAAVNNGSGLVRLTIADNATTGVPILVTGDRVTVSAVGGVTGAAGPFIVTVIDPHTIDLQGSAFGGAYTSGGVVYLNTFYRSGVGFNYDVSVDWGQMDTCFTYGYTVGIRINSSNDTTLMNCGADGYAAAQDTSTIGMLVTGTAENCSLVACKTAAQGVGVKCDSTAAGARNNVYVTNHRAWGNITYSYQVSNGFGSFVNCDTSSLVTAARIDNAAIGATFIGGSVSRASVFHESAATPRASFMSAKGVPLDSFNPVANAVSGTTGLMRYELHNTTPTNNDTLFASYFLTNNAGTQLESVRESYRLQTVAAGAETSALFWGVRIAGVLTNVAQVDGSGFVPLANNTYALGGASLRWSRLYLANNVVSALPLATTAAGMRAHVNDSTVVAAGNFGNVVAGGGVNHNPVWSDGTAWRIG